MNRIRQSVGRHWMSLAGTISLIGSLACSTAFSGPLVFCCAVDNDLFRVASENQLIVKRCDSPTAAIDAAEPGSGVLLLADGYPAQTTPLDATVFVKAAGKKLRLYVEYPSFLPGCKLGIPSRTRWERGVIASDVFAPHLKKLRILAIHDCHFVPLDMKQPLVIVGRVAGFDTAVFGLPKQAHPILCELPAGDHSGPVLVSTTKLSNFITARYAPSDAWSAIWRYVFTWLQPESEIHDLKWTASVRPSFGPAEELPQDVERQALQRGIDWYFRSRMLLSPSRLARYNRPTGQIPAKEDGPDSGQDWANRIAPMSNLEEPGGDGSLGVLEGFDARIFFNGNQPVRWWLRADCNGEIAGTLATAGAVLKEDRYQKTAANIGDWLYFRSMMSLGNRANPKHPAYGLIGWNDTPHYVGPGSIDGYSVYYGDDNARSMLGMMLAAAALKTDRYDERLLKCLLANLRLSGQLGTQPDRINEAPLVRAGWRKHFDDRSFHSSTHYQAYLWACYLWAYRETGFHLFLQRAKAAIGETMKIYPKTGEWNSSTRARALLPLAWLVRVEDTPEHRAWLRKFADDLLATQDASSGAIREKIDKIAEGVFPPPASNEAYGTTETPVIQQNGDPICDLLYTTNFALLGLHEAAAATGDAFYSKAEDKLVRFLCRIQVRSKDHPELDGAWFRSFDFQRWEYWGSNADAGWGAWCIEAGWTQSWLTAILGLRQMNSSLWDITQGSQIEKHFEATLPTMFTEDVLKEVSKTR